MGLPLLLDPSIAGLQNDSGAGTNGTIVNEAVFDAIASALDDVLIGALTVQTPGETTDEVFTARGTTASLDARISGVIAADGSLNAVAIQGGVIVTAGEDLAANTIAYMSDGSGALTAGRWYKADADFTYASTTPALGYVLNAITSGAQGYVYQFGLMTGLSGLTPGAKYYVSSAAGQITATPPTNAAVVGQAASATTLVLELSPKTQLAQPYPARFQHTASSGVMTGPAPVRLASQIGAGSAAGVETTLCSFTLSANSLPTDADSLDFFYTTSFAPNASVKTLKFYFGTASIILTAAAHNSKKAIVSGRVVRTGAAAQVTHLLVTVEGSTPVLIYMGSTEALNADVLVKFTGNSAGAGDINSSLLSAQLI